MKALILNSGIGSRMGVLTLEHPKCMTEISHSETILSRQLKLLAEYGVSEVVITTGAFDGVLVNYCSGVYISERFWLLGSQLHLDPTSLQVQPNS